jgi:cell division protein FtsL
MESSLNELKGMIESLRVELVAKAEKVTQLNNKVTMLEEKVTKQEAEIADLKHHATVTEQATDKLLVP